jgi:tRNA-Thr(GGU) m(6)t(6)A37 methyltransferase TsaA
MSLSIQPIGIVRSSVTDAEELDVGWRSAVAEIHIEPALAPGLQGIEDWSHLVVIFFMHEVHFDPDQHLVFRPGGRPDMPQVGVFAQRSRFYPNSIGLTAVELLKVEDNVLTVKGLDAIDGTPVLAIKPYTPVFDSAQEPTVPIWFVRFMQG